MSAYSITARELALRTDIPEELLSGKHLIYSSPATLSFNSPGAQGFGVKRAGLAIPGSVMLLVAPGCCGRNTTMQSRMSGYEDRFFYLLQDDTDIVTGRHLKKIPQAVKEIVDHAEKKPTAVMICITCVDALLGTDMDRVCKKCTEEAGVPVLPCYMYALEREGRVPPMTQVRSVIYDLLEPAKRSPRAVNLLGEFAPFEDSSELYQILKSLGIRKIHEISRCHSIEEYHQMSSANFNIVINPQSRMAADKLAKRIGVPYLELTRLYQLDKIHRQYELFAAALGANVDDSLWYEQAKQTVETFCNKHPGLTVTIGETLNADSFELALALLRYGFRVPEIYGTVSDQNRVYIRRIAELSPETRIYSNLSPTMLNYDMDTCKPDLTIGADAEYYHPDAANIPWNREIQPFGYTGLMHLFEEMEQGLAGKEEQA